MGTREPFGSAAIQVRLADLCTQSVKLLERSLAAQKQSRVLIQHAANLRETAQILRHDLAILRQEALLLVEQQGHSAADRLKQTGKPDEE